MRRLKHILFAISSVLSLALLGIAGSAVAACNSSGTIGNVSVSSSVPAAGDYVVWVRMQQSTPSNNSVLVEVDGSSCFSVGSASLPANNWVWVNYKGSTTTDVMKYTFGSGGSKTIKLFAKNYGVKIDRVILLGAEEQCSSNGATPSGDGSNCSTGPSVVVSDSGGGSTNVTPTIVTADPENVEKVEYYVDGELVQSAEGAEGFDASQLDNGEYQLTTKVTYKDGTTAQADETIEVNNDSSVLAVTKRWSKRNQKALYIAAGSLTIAGLVSSGYFLTRYLHHRHLYFLTHWPRHT